MEKLRSKTTSINPGWFGVALSTLLIILISSLVLYPQPTPETILIALRITSLTTALPLLLVFVAQPVAALSQSLAQWIQANRRYLWMALTLSHLVHLYQISLYYQLGQQCPLMVWLITTPVWLIMVVIAAVELARPQWVDAIYQKTAPLAWKLIYSLGLGYVWLVFTLSFGLGTVGKHLLFYNVPAFLLFLGGGGLYLVRWGRKIALKNG